MSPTSGMTVTPFDRNRIPTIDAGEIGRHVHHVSALLEVDVSLALGAIQKARHDLRKAVSLTAWVGVCIARAMAAFPETRSLRHGTRKTVIFDHVDLCLVVQKKIDGSINPLPVIVRACDTKSVDAVQKEIRSAAKRSLVSGEFHIGNRRMAFWTRIYLRLPQPVRLFFWRLFLKNPIQRNARTGLAMLTAVGLDKRVPAWPLFTSTHPLAFGLGSVCPKPVVRGKKVVVREILHLTVLADHDMIDGRPLARFLETLTGLLESAEGLDTLSV